MVAPPLLKYRLVSGVRFVNVVNSVQVVLFTDNPVSVQVDPSVEYSIFPN